MKKLVFSKRTKLFSVIESGLSVHKLSAMEKSFIIGGCCPTNIPSNTSDNCPQNTCQNICGHGPCGVNICPEDECPNDVCIVDLCPVDVYSDSECDSYSESYSDIPTIA